MSYTNSVLRTTQREKNAMEIGKEIAELLCKKDLSYIEAKKSLEFAMDALMWVSVREINPPKD